MTKTLTRQKYTLFTGKALLFLIAPIIIESIFSTSLGLFDSMMVSSIYDINDAGEKIFNAGTAVSNVDTFNHLIIQLFSAFGTGGAIITSQYLGAKQYKDANESAKQMVVFVALMSIGLGLFCVALNGPILKLLYSGVPDITMKYSKQYFYLTAASFPFIGIFNACAALLRAQRKSVYTMVSAALSCALNVGFNAIFIYVLNMKVIGAGLATLICRSIPAVFMLLLLTKKSYIVHFKIFEKFRFNGRMLKKILALALPSGIESCLFHLGKIMTNIFVNVSYYNAGGTNLQANGNAIACNINNLASVVGSGVGTSALTVIGQAVGTGDEKQVKYYIKKIFIISYILNACSVLLIMGTAHWLVLLYQYTSKAQEIALKCLYLCLSFQIVTYPMSFTTPAVLKATSDVRYVMKAAILSMIVVRVGLCFVLTHDLFPFRLGAMGYWISMCADWTTRSVLFILRLAHGKWKNASGLLNQEFGESERQAEEAVGELFKKYGT